MSGSDKCQSCGMPIESGVYCPHCVDAQGNLQSFEERFERMVQWAASREPGLTRDAAERRTRDYMRTLPAWRDHPKLKM